MSTARRHQSQLTLIVGSLAVAASAAAAATYLASRFGLFASRQPLGPGSSSSSTLKDSLLPTKKPIPGEEEFYDTDEEKEKERLEQLRREQSAAAESRAALASDETQKQLEQVEPASPDNLATNPRLWSDDKLRSWLAHVSRRNATSRNSHSVYSLGWNLIMLLLFYSNYFYSVMLLFLRRSLAAS